MSAPQHQSHGKEINSSADTNLSFSILEKHSDTLSTLVKNLWEKDKEKGKRKVHDSLVSILFSQVKNTKIRTTNEYGTKQVTVSEIHRYVHVEDQTVGYPNKPKEPILACKYSCGRLFARKVKIRIMRGLCTQTKQI